MPQSFLKTACRLTMACGVLGVVAIAYLAGYRVGYIQAWNEAFERIEVHTSIRPKH